jgi:hypothetical protein
MNFWNDGNHRYFPLLFSGPMIRAIQDRRKTQTLRICKPQPQLTKTVSPDHADGFEWCMRRRKTLHMSPTAESFAQAYDRYLEGDRIWCRETTYEGTFPSGRPYVMYKADELCQLPDGAKWKPSIHMPREHCRLLLEVVRDCGIVRLQDLDIEDLNKEGLVSRCVGKGRSEWLVGDDDWRPFVNIHEAFPVAWDKLNGHRATWESNPWVHKIEFDVLLQGNRIARHKSNRVSRKSMQAALEARW